MQECDSGGPANLLKEIEVGHRGPDGCEIYLDEQSWQSHPFSA